MIEGLRLRRVWELIMGHQTPWIHELPADAPFLGDNDPVIRSITFKEVLQPAALAGSSHKHHSTSRRSWIYSKGISSNDADQVMTEESKKAGGVMEALFVSSGALVGIILNRLGVLDRAIAAIGNWLGLLPDAAGAAADGPGSRTRPDGASAPEAPGAATVGRGPHDNHPVVPAPPADGMALLGGHGLSGIQSVVSQASDPSGGGNRLPVTPASPKGPSSGRAA
ncbi:MAG TPA: hypothetical protein VFF52_03335 [Isosphaeraceae bacterium]|nr:hypothetical protein [Isosphaeraceae bacterium]